MSATNRGAKRSPQDEYQTPLWCIQALLPYINWKKARTLLEPCKGDGHVFSSIPRGIKKSWCEINEGRDYLKYKPRNEFDLIITNPPFSISLPFIMKSLAEAKTVVYLLRLNWLGSIDREEFVYHNNPDYILTLTPRPSFEGGGSDACEYGWVIWDRGELVTPGTRRFESIGRLEKGSKKIPVPVDDIILPPSLKKPSRRRRRPVTNEIDVEA